MPTVLFIGPYRFFFNSREEPRMHIHISTADGTAKYWLEPRIELAVVHNLKSRELREIESIIQERADEFRNAWNKHFSQ